MDALIAILTEEALQAARFVPRVFVALLVLVATWLVSRWAGHVLLQILERSQLSKTHRRFTLQVFRGAILVLGASGALQVVGLQGLAAGLLASGGVTAVVLGFAFREIGENFLAGVLLGIDRGFDVGDLIRVGDFEGEVTAIDLRTTQIRTPDGRDVFVPNSQLVNGAVVNFTVDGLRRPSFRVGIDYANDARRAIELIVDAVSQVDDVQAEPPPRALLAELADGWVTLEVSVWVDTFKADAGVMRVRSDCMEATRATLLAHGFTVSSETTTNVDLQAKGALPVAVSERPPT